MVALRVSLSSPSGLGLLSDDRRRRVRALRLPNIYLSINERLYYPSEWTRLKSRDTPERGRGGRVDTLRELYG